MTELNIQKLANIFYIFLGVIIGALYFTLKIPLIIPTLIYMGVLSPYLIYIIKSFLEEEELEEKFPLFLRDLSYYIEIGQPLPIALKSVKNNDYGKKLNKEIRKILAEMSVGVPFTEAFSRMEKRIRSEKVKKAIISIIEIEKYGGKIENSFISIVDTLQSLLDIKKERISRIRNFMFTYYLIFFGFIGIIIATILFFKSLLQVKKGILFVFKDTAMYLVMLNALFTGLVVGKAVFGRINAGIMHSIILVTATAIAFSILGFFL